MFNFPWISHVSKQPSIGFPRATVQIFRASLASSALPSMELASPTKFKDGRGMYEMLCLVVVNKVSNG